MSTLRAVRSKHTDSDGPTKKVSTPPHATSAKGPQSKKGKLPSDSMHTRPPIVRFQVVGMQRDDVSCPNSCKVMTAGSPST